MRVLVTMQPAPSHLAPMLPYLRALESAGHQVLVATARSFVPDVERSGLRGAACGLDWLETDAAATFPELRSMSGADQTLYFLQHVFGTVTADAMVDGLGALTRDWEPDVVLWDSWELGAHVAAELRGLPHVCVAVGARVPPFMLSAVLGERLDGRRLAHGLDPDPSCEALYRHGCASLFPPSWLSAAPHPLDGERFFHPAPDYACPTPPRSDVPLVYVTLGTVFNRLPGVMESLLEGLGRGPWRVLATVGRDRDVAELGPQPDNVTVRQFVPQREFLHTCSVVVHHSGFGTVMDCLVARVPQLVLPLSADQGKHAEAVLRLGLGTTVESALEDAPVGHRLVDTARLQPDQVRAAVQSLLEDAECRRRVVEFGDQLAALPREDAFVALVEELSAAR